MKNAEELPVPYAHGGLLSLLLGIDEHIVYPADSLGEVVLADADDNVKLAGALIYHLYVDTSMSHRSKDTCNCTPCVFHSASDYCKESDTVLYFEVVGVNSLAEVCKHLVADRVELFLSLHTRLDW